MSTAANRSSRRPISEAPATLTLPGQVDAALFSLSYSVLPDREMVLRKAWEALRPDGRLVIMDAGPPNSPLGRLLGPIGEAIATIFPGDPLFATVGRSHKPLPDVVKRVVSIRHLLHLRGPQAGDEQATDTLRPMTNINDPVLMSRASPRFSLPARPAQL